MPFGEDSIHLLESLEKNVEVVWKNNGILLPGNSLKFPLVKVIVSKIAYKSLKITKNSHFLRKDHRNVVHEIFLETSEI